MKLRHPFQGVALALALVVAGAAMIPSQVALAAGQGARAATDVAVRQVLEPLVGKHAKLKLVSGQELEGKVISVDEHLVVVNELAGMEYFGATVRLDQVAAVITRTVDP